MAVHHLRRGGIPPSPPCACDTGTYANPVSVASWPLDPPPPPPKTKADSLPHPLSTGSKGRFVQVVGPDSNPLTTRSLQVLGPSKTENSNWRDYKVSAAFPCDTLCISPTSGTIILDVCATFARGARTAPRSHAAGS